VQLPVDPQYVGCNTALIRKLLNQPERTHVVLANTSCKQCQRLWSLPYLENMSACSSRHSVVPAGAVLGVVAKIARVRGVAVGHSSREVL